MGLVGRGNETSGLILLDRVAYLVRTNERTNKSRARTHGKCGTCLALDILYSVQICMYSEGKAYVCMYVCMYRILSEKGILYV